MHFEIHIDEGINEEGDMPIDQHNANGSIYVSWRGQVAMKSCPQG
jgi:hypothetical protein